MLTRLVRTAAVDCAEALLAVADAVVEGEDGFAVSASFDDEPLAVVAAELVDEPLAAMAAGLGDATAVDGVALLQETGVVALQIEVDLVSLIFGENALPANAEDGLLPEIAGGESMVKAVVAEMTPSVVTVTVGVPGLAIRLEGIAASSCVESLKAVVSAMPFHATVEPGVKSVPWMVSVNAAPPAVAEAGLRPMSAGGAANTAGVHASARTTGKTAFHLRMSLRALCIWSILHGVKHSLATPSLHRRQRLPGPLGERHRDEPPQLRNRQEFRGQKVTFV